MYGLVESRTCWVHAIAVASAGSQACSVLFGELQDFKHQPSVFLPIIQQQIYMQQDPGSRNMRTVAGMVEAESVYQYGQLGGSYCLH